MDNLKYYNDSLAYDFDMFMPKTKVREEELDNIVKIPTAKVKQRTRRRTVARTFSASVAAIMISVFVFAGLCGNIFLRLKINEVNAQINEVNNKLETLDSEKTSLGVELERRISYSNIEVEAAKLGMQKMEKDQVKYIRVNDTNTANVKGKTLKNEK